jgi:hypothetical protein
MSTWIILRIDIPRFYRIENGKRTLAREPAAGSAGR